MSTERQSLVINMQYLNKVLSLQRHYRTILINTISRRTNFDENYGTTKNIEEWEPALIRVKLKRDFLWNTARSGKFDTQTVFFDVDQKCFLGKAQKMLFICNSENYLKTQRAIELLVQNLNFLRAKKNLHLDQCKMGLDRIALRTDSFPELRCVVYMRLN